MKAVIIIFIFISLCLISGQVLCVRVFGCTGGSLMFECMISNQRKTDDQHKVKYFCRDRGCKMGISTDVQSRWVYNGRFALYDDENSRFFTVFIRNLNREDDGEYTCGNNQTWSHNVTLVESKESRCGKSVIRDGYLGQKKITFRCEYDEKFKTHTKVFYRLNKDPVHVLNSSRSSQSSENFILSDSHKDHFTVTIRDISAADGGVYLCGVERDESDHRPSETSITHITFIKEIQLNVYVPPVVGREGDSSEIKCSYDENHSTEIKHLCKGKCFTKDAQNIISSDKVHVNNPKISVKDDTELNLFTVTLSDLTAEDAGIYWCAVKEAFNLPIELLIVLKDALFTHEASVGGSVSISCKNVRTQTQRLFCRGDQPNICVRDGVRVSSNTRTNGRFSLTDETSAGVFTVNISNLTEEDSGKYWCAEETSGSFVFTEVHLHVTQETTSPYPETTTSQDEGKSVSSVIVVVSVGLILLAVCLVLMLLKIKYSCKHGVMSSSDRRETGDHEMVQDSDPTSTPLYSTVQLPTIPSDSQNPLYSSVQLPTIPSDSQNPLYSTVQLPTIPSDSQNPLYSSIPSDRVLYASVSFQKHEESLSDATVSFRKNEIHSDYASVKHSNTPN